MKVGNYGDIDDGDPYTFSSDQSDYGNHYVPKKLGNLILFLSTKINTHLLNEIIRKW